MRRNFTKRKLKGVTLLEMLVYLIVFGLIISTIVGFAVTITDSQRKEGKETATYQDAMFVLEHLTSKISKSRSIDLTNTILDSDAGILRLNLTSGVGEYSITDNRISYYDGTDTTPITQETNNVTKFRVEPRFHLQAQLITFEITMTINGKNFQTTFTIK